MKSLFRKLERIPTFIPDVRKRIIREGDILQMSDPLPMTSNNIKSFERFYIKGKLGKVVYRDGCFVYQMSNTRRRVLTSAVVRAFGLKIVGRLK